MSAVWHNVMLPALSIKVHDLICRVTIAITAQKLGNHKGRERYKRQRERKQIWSIKRRTERTPLQCTQKWRGHTLIAHGP